jgi:hypothetical protein
LKIAYDEPLSNVDFNLNLRPCAAAREEKLHAEAAAFRSEAGEILRTSTLSTLNLLLLLRILRASICEVIENTHSTDLEFAPPLPRAVRKYEHSPCSSLSVSHAPILVECSVSMTLLRGRGIGGSGGNGGRGVQD